MSIFYGKALKIQIFGASHADEIGVRVLGLPKGMVVDYAHLRAFMHRRSPGNDPLTSARREADEPVFISGVIDGRTDGHELCAVIKNTDVRSSDYVNLKLIPRPGHADLCAWQKYGNDYDMSGGGVFSGRMTAPLCIIGAIAIEELERRGISVKAHAVSAHPGLDLRDEAQIAMADGDSVGAYVSCRVDGLPAGLGGALFDGLDAEISSLIFSIPGVKGIEFGAGFEAPKMCGSENNDQYAIENGKVVYLSNNSGGILGGVSTGMPLEFRVAFKPTPSIAKAQKSVDLRNMTNVTLSVSGRHDPCFALRTPPVVESAAAIAILDIMLTEDRYTELLDKRRRIDCIDSRIVDLLRERLAVCGEIADYKKALDLPVLDALREKEKLDSIPCELRPVFETIIKCSREFQEEKIDG